MRVESGHARLRFTKGGGGGGGGEHCIKEVRQGQKVTISQSRTIKVLITVPKKFNSNLQLALLLEPKNTSKVASGA